MLRGARVIVAGLVSAKADAGAAVAELALLIRDAGGEMIGHCVQRRGVSRSNHPGGAARMDLPLNRRTLMGRGKVGELARMCGELQATVVVFLNELNHMQRDQLQRITGVRGVDRRELMTGR